MSTKLNPAIEAISMPSRIASLPVGPNGMPVPWFVAWVDGKPEFRAADGSKFAIAIREKKCWVCGQPLARFMTFVVGPMCGINRVSSEPPSHTACAHYSVRACPFLSRPRMERREGGLDELMEKHGGSLPAGEMIRRNPGVTLLWTTTSYSLFGDGRGGTLIRMGNPAGALEWFREGRPATHDEVAESVRTGLPALEAMSREQPGGPEALARVAADFVRFYPAKAV